MIIICLLLCIMHTSCRKSEFKDGRKAIPVEPSIDSMFDKTSNDIFSNLLGDINHIKQNYLDTRVYTQNYSETSRKYRKPEDRFENVNFTTKIDTTTQKIPIFTVKPFGKKPPEAKEMIEFIKLRMLRRDLNILLKENKTLIPKFENGDDDPLQLTRRFDMDLGPPDEEEPEPFNETRRVIYFYKETYRNHYAEKYRLAELMRQFIYMTRYKMSIMTELRKKYLFTIKYKLGYLFGLYRMVKMQQRTIYSTLKTYHQTLNNPTITHQLFYKIVQLDVDLDDLIRFIRRLDVHQKLFYWPRYFDDTSDYYADQAPKLSSPVQPPG